MSPTSFDAYISSNIPTFFASASFQPKHVPVDTIHKVFNQLVLELKPTYDYMKEVTPPSVLNHSIRCFYFAYSLLQSGYPSGTQGVKQIEHDEVAKRLFLVCILHDIGCMDHPTILSHPAHTTSYEVHGGILTYEHLLKSYTGLSEDALGEVVQGVIFHTFNTGWKGGKSSTTEFLVALCALFDTIGKDLYPTLGLEMELWNRDTILEIEKAYPRESFIPDYGPLLGKEFVGKPNCIIPRLGVDIGKLLKVQSLLEE